MIHEFQVELLIECFIMTGVDAKVQVEEATSSMLNNPLIISGPDR